MLDDPPAVPALAASCDGNNNLGYGGGIDERRRSRYLYKTSVPLSHLSRSKLSRSSDYSNLPKPDSLFSISLPWIKYRHLLSLASWREQSRVMPWVHTMLTLVRCPSLDFPPAASWLVSSVSPTPEPSRRALASLPPVPTTVLVTNM